MTSTEFVRLQHCAACSGTGWPTSVAATLVGDEVVCGPCIGAGVRVAFLDGVPVARTIWMLLQEIVNLTEGATLEQDLKVVGAIEELLDMCEDLGADDWPLRRFHPGETESTEDAHRPSIIIVRDRPALPVRSTGYVELRDGPGNPIGWSPAWSPTGVLSLVAAHLHQIAPDPVGSLITERLAHAVDRLWPVPTERWCDDVSTAPPSARTAVIPRPGEPWPPPPEPPPF